MKLKPSLFRLIIISILSSGLGLSIESSLRQVLTPDATYKWLPVKSGASPSAPSVEILEETSTHLKVKWDISGIFIDDVNTSMGQFQRIHFGNPGALDASDAGLPALPCLTEMVRIPSGMKASATIIKIEWIEVCQAYIAPYQLPRRDGNKQPPFHFNTQAYESNDPLPETIASVGNTQGWGGILVASLNVCPVKYYPATRKVELAQSITIRVDFRPDGNRSIIQPGRINHRMQQLHQASLLNPPPEMLEPLDSDDNEPVRMLVIVKEEALETAQPLINFHHNSGLRTEIWMADDIEDEFEIKDRVIEMYENGLEYLLLIGDGYVDDPDIPMHHWDSDYEGGEPDDERYDVYSDNWYACLDPPDEDNWDDHLPELAVGRLVYQDQDNIDQLELQVSKLMDYYDWNLDDRDNAEWLSRCLLIADNPTDDNEFHDYELRHYIGTKNRVLNADYDHNAPEFITAYGDQDDIDNDFVIEQMNEVGMGIVNYRGHGSQLSWSGWSPNQSFGSVQIRELENRSRPFILVSSACLNGDIAEYLLRGNNFDNRDCLVEKFQKQNGGSLSAHGCVISTFTEGNSHFDSTLFLAWFDEGIYDLGYASNYASTSMVNYYQRRQPATGQLNFRAYLWLGDPALEIKLGAPGELEVDISEQIPIGSEEVEAIIQMNDEPLENARFCLRSEDDEIYLVGNSDHDGRVTLMFEEPPEEVMQLDWMVYHRNAIPATGEIQVVSEIGTIMGTVTEFADGSTFEGAELALSPFDYTAVSDAEGQYRFEDIPAVQYELTVTAEGFHTQSINIEVIEDEVTTENIALRFSHLELDSTEIWQYMELDQEPVEREIALTNTGNGDLTWNAEIEYRGEYEPYEQIGSFGPLAPLGDRRLFGIAFIGDSIFVAGGNNNAFPNYIYVFNFMCDRIRHFAQPEQSVGFGFRDLASRNGYLYGSSDSQILKFDLAGEVNEVIEGPYDPNEALAVDDEGNIWIGHGASPLVKIDEEGNELQSIELGQYVKGLAWYPEEPDSCYLLAYVQGDNEESVRLYKVNPVTEEFIYEANLTDDESETVGSGLTVTNSYDPGRWTLAGMVYNGEDRWLRIWNLSVETGWLSIAPDTGSIEPDQETAVNVTFNTENFQTSIILNANLIITNNGNEPRIELPITLATGAYEAPIEYEAEIPDRFGIIKAYPNPFNSIVKISYTLDEEAKISLNIFDLYGREVATLQQGQMSTGSYEAVWQAGNTPSGIYLCKLESGKCTSTKKIILVR
ncbi:MAG: C25 family cysteine peptidase [Candidatus Hatepunaea meridiana]|nr:C25 family cysteine peptidase [Candidatus Hatepunaea meridiana]